MSEKGARIFYNPQMEDGIMTLQNKLDALSESKKNAVYPSMLESQLELTKSAQHEFIVENQYKGLDCKW